MMLVRLHQVGNECKGAMAVNMPNLHRIQMCANPIFRLVHFLISSSQSTLIIGQGLVPSPMRNRGGIFWTYLGIHLLPEKVALSFMFKSTSFDVVYAFIMFYNWKYLNCFLGKNLILISMTFTTKFDVFCFHFLHLDFKKMC